MMNALKIGLRISRNSEFRAATSDITSPTNNDNFHQITFRA